MAIPTYIPGSTETASLPAGPIQAGSMQVQYIVSAEQMDSLLASNRQAVENERQALEMASRLLQENTALLAGLKHYTREEVAGLFHCSTKQIERYDKDGLLPGRRMLGKVLYPADKLLAFARTFDQTEAASQIQTELTSALPRRASIRRKRAGT